MRLLHRYARRAYSHGGLACLVACAVAAAFVLRPGPAGQRRAAAEGHALGNHTWHHAYLARMEPECARAQIEATTNAIEAVTGLRTRWFRPPGGHYDPQVVRLCNELGQVIVLWSDTPGDWLHP